jgi:hypothetical protein
MVLQRPTEPDQLGVGTLTVEATIVDRSQVVPTLSVDGVVRHEGTLSGDCRYGCTLTWPWDTAGLEGGHDLAIIATDPFGRTASVAQSVELGDIPYASAIEITGETDNIGFGSLEVEIHLFDADTGAFLGCSGEHSGMESVDESNQRYPVLAWFQDTSGVHVPMSSLAGRNVRVDVIEDDAYPCPQTADLGADDPVGSSPATPAESFATLQPMSFQNVVYLELSAGRPYER